MSYIGKSPSLGAYNMLDSLTASATASYSLTLGSTAFVPESANHLLVSLNGVIQKAGSSYTVSGSTLTFSSSLASSDSIDFVLALGNVLDIGTPSDSTISTAKIIDNAVTGAKFNADVISGQTELSSEPADTDEFLVSDAGVLKRIDYSLIKGGGGFTRVGGGSATGQNLGDISFDVFSATYNLYYVQYRINMVADSAQVWMRVRTSSGYKTNAGYRYAIEGSNSNGTHSSSLTASGTEKFQLTGGTTSADNHNSAVGSILFYKPFASTHNTDVIISATEFDESAVVTARHGGGSHQVNESHVGFGFLGNNQNIEQYDVQIYGLNES